MTVKIEDVHFVTFCDHLIAGVSDGATAKYASHFMDTGSGGMCGYGLIPIGNTGSGWGAGSPVDETGCVVYWPQEWQYGTWEQYESHRLL